MMSNTEFEGMKEWGRKKQEEIEEWLNKIAEEYKDLPEDKLRERLTMQDTETLRWICSDIALPTEHYELCKIAKEILEVRGDSL